MYGPMSAYTLTTEAIKYLPKQAGGACIHANIGHVQGY